MKHFPLLNFSGKPLAPASLQPWIVLSCLALLASPLVLAAEPATSDTAGRDHQLKLVRCG